MNRTDLAGKLATKMGTTKKEAEAFAKLYEETLTEALVEDGKVALTGFLTYEIVDVAEEDVPEKTYFKGTEREVTKPAHTKEAYRKPKVTIGKALKEAVNQ